MNSILGTAKSSVARPLGRAVLTLNGGSSSLKFALHATAAGKLEMLLDGNVQVARPRDNLLHIRALLQRMNLPMPVLIAHRVVHGGPDLRRHCVVDDEVLVKIDAASALAPLHNSATLDNMCSAAELFDDAVQLACLDTVFHQTMPSSARTLPIGAVPGCPELQRYGFHGLSCESIVHQLAAETPRRLIIAHLGHGASITAVEAGRSLDNSMGLTPSGGLLMGTRSGDLDPGVLMYLLRERQFDASRLEALVNHRAGLLGISGTSSDMRTLREAAPDDPRAQLAVQMFCQSVARSIAGMIALLGGVDMLVFTGGIGENDAATRADVCGALDWMGIRLDRDDALRHDGAVQAADSRCAIRVLPSLENEQMARHAVAVFNRSAASRPGIALRRHETSGP